MSYKQEQKELKKPDELQRLGQTAVPWMERHGQSVLIAVAGVGVIGLIITVVNHLQDRAERDASARFGAALMVLDREVKPDATPVPGNPSAPFTSEAEKDQALIAELTTFRASGPGPRAAANAALPMAQALLRLGKPDEALPLIEEYLAGSDPADTLRPAALEARGYALEAQGKLDDALVAFDRMAAETRTDFLEGMGEYHRGRILMLKGDLAGAARAFSDAQGKAADSAAARLAKERLQTLAAQGVEIPRPAAAAVDAGS